jgi:hypothetical protein
MKQLDADNRNLQLINQSWDKIFLFNWVFVDVDVSHNFLILTKMFSLKKSGILQTTTQHFLSSYI